MGQVAAHIQVRIMLVYKVFTVDHGVFWSSFPASFMKPSLTAEHLVDRLKSMVQAVEHSGPLIGQGTMPNCEPQLHHAMTLFLSFGSFSGMQFNAVKQRLRIGDIKSIFSRLRLTYTQTPNTRVVSVSHLPTCAVLASCMRISCLGSSRCDSGISTSGRSHCWVKVADPYLNLGYRAAIGHEALDPPHKLTPQALRFMIT